jgi:nitroreductase/ubiquinone/menaquinone biosynthesis C-methylase UbiE
MNPTTDQQTAADFYALTYDLSVSDWPGEIDFYQALAEKVKSAGGIVLELACGTGRVALRLAQQGVAVTGLDLSPAMIAIARQKSAGLENICWVVGDMRDFTLPHSFDLAIIPGHSFQNLNSSADQLACLESIHRHLKPGGTLVVHLDHMNRANLDWLAGLCGEQGGKFEAAESFSHPLSGNPVQAYRAWSYEPATQTATARTAWEELDADGQVVQRIEKRPVRLHCLFRFEMEHLLARAGFEIQAVYGDFSASDLRDDSPEMIWVAQATDTSPLHFIFSRRSIRSYTDQPVEREKIIQILQAAMAAPSACNSQPWEFVVVDELQALNELRAQLYSGQYNAPAAIVVCGNEAIAHNTSGRAFWVQDCSAATENILIAAAALGLGSVWIGVHPYESTEKRVAKAVNLPEGVIPLCVIYLGYPTQEKPPRTQYEERRVHWQQYVPRKKRAKVKNAKFLP